MPSAGPRTCERETTGGEFFCVWRSVGDDGLVLAVEVGIEQVDHVEVFPTLTSEMISRVVGSHVPREQPGGRNGPLRVGTRESARRVLMLGSTAPWLGCRSGRFRGARHGDGQVVRRQTLPLPPARKPSHDSCRHHNGDNPMSFVNRRDIDRSMPRVGSPTPGGPNFQRLLGRPLGPHWFPLTQTRRESEEFSEQKGTQRGRW